MGPRKRGFLGRWMPRLIAVVLTIVVVGFVLHQFFGLGIEMTGSGWLPRFTFHDEGAHIEALEEHRSAQESAASAASAAAESSRDWSLYRGARMDGVYDGPILVDWAPEGPPRLWRQPVGGGYAGFAVGSGLAFTIEQRRDEEVVAAYDPRTGVEAWTHAWSAAFREAMGGDGPRATPAYHDGVVYALGAAGELRALRAADGSLIWRTDILDDAGVGNLQWGMAGSPLPVDGQLIVNPGGSEGSVISYRLSDGEVLWRALSDSAAYTAPMVVELAGLRQILVVTGERAVGLTLEGEGPLWEYPWVTEYGVNAAQPVIVGEDRFVLSAGYGHGAALVEVERDDGSLRAREVWQNRNLKNKFSSSVFYRGHVYGLDEGILVCIDVESGDRLWKGGRYGHGQLLLADGHLVILGEKGQLALVRATPEELDERFVIDAIDGKTWNNPAMTGGGILLVRNAEEMAAFDLSPR